MGELVYRRKLSAEEVDEGFLFITKEGLKVFGSNVPTAGRFSITVK